MNIKTIVDKIVKEADINPREYTVADRIVDVNAEYLYRAEKANQIGSLIPPSSVTEADIRDDQEVFTVVSGSNIFLRTIPDAPIVRVDFKHSGSDRYDRVKKDQSRMVNGYCIGDQKYFANEKQIFVENGVAGELRVTYAHGSITPFTVADYEEDPEEDIPSPDWLPEVFHPLLWLKPAMVQAGYYKKDRYPVLKAEFDRLDVLFDNRYGRNSARDLRFETGDDNCFGIGGRNNR
jgi:hypothetical protein